MTTPFLRIGPQTPQLPVILSVPHAGRAYDADLLGRARVGREVLELLEDRLVDRLVWRATAAGATAFVAQTPRAEIDLNRDEREIDPAAVQPPLPARGTIQTARVRGGLGLVPTRLGGTGALWRAPLPRDVLERRLEATYRPYHQAVAEALHAARARFGAAVLLDCHSMPPREPGPNGPAPHVVLGDRHGATADISFILEAVRVCEEEGYRVVRNVPYAGGHVVSRHGQPLRGIHALQLELDRASYLDPDLKAPGPGFEAATRLIERLTDRLATLALARDLPLAAE